MKRTNYSIENYQLTIESDFVYRPYTYEELPICPLSSPEEQLVKNPLGGTVASRAAGRSQELERPECFGRRPGHVISASEERSNKCRWTGHRPHGSR